MKNKLLAYIFGIILLLSVVIPNVRAPPLGEGGFAAGSVGPFFLTPNGSVTDTTNKAAMKGTYNITFNATLINTPDTGGGWFNASFYIANRSVGTQASPTTWVFLANATNTSDAIMLWTIQFNTNGYADGNYSINVTLHNRSGSTPGQWTKGVQSIFIDNGVPTSTYGSDNPADNSITSNTTVTFSTAAGLSTQSCTLNFNSGQNTTVVTPSSNLCTLSIYSIPKSSYPYFWSTTDGLNTSTFATRRIAVQDSTGGGFVIQQAQQQQQAQKNTMNILVIIGIIGAIWYFTRNN